jgi:sensor c-di-GMP phosphodiesterase-like protein
MCAGGHVIPERSLDAVESRDPLDLHVGLDGGHFEVAGMPVVWLAEGTVVGIEALAGWRTVEGQALLPV